MKGPSHMELQMPAKIWCRTNLHYAEDSLKSRTEKLLSHFNSNFYLNIMLNLKMMIKTKDSIQSNVGELDGIVHSIAFAPRESLKGDFVDSYSMKVLPLHIKSAVIVLEIWPKTYHRC